MIVRHRIRHEMKCCPEFFQPTLNGLKHFELRRDDRPEGFQVGDELLLKEWDPVLDDRYLPFRPRGYTGREVLVRVDYSMDADTVRKLIHPLLEPDEMDGFVIMSVSLVN